MFNMTEQEVKDATYLSEEEFLNKYTEIGISRLKSKLYRFKMCYFSLKICQLK